MKQPYKEAQNVSLVKEEVSKKDKKKKKKKKDDEKDKNKPGASGTPKPHTR